MGWPIIASKWLERQRKWPTKEIIKTVTTHCYLIAKPSSEEKDNPNTTEFCFSFAYTEYQLIQYQSEHQRFGISHIQNFILRIPKTLRY